jgi:hypothetical protein
MHLRRRRVPIWIATFAVLLHLFAMPLMGANMRAMADTGGHCPKADASPHAKHAVDQHQSPDEPAPQPNHHQGMPCCCAAGAASLAAIATGTPVLHQPRLVALGRLHPATAPPLTPRYRWPSLNPRASPFA